MEPEQLRRRWLHARQVCFSKGWKDQRARKAKPLSLVPDAGKDGTRTTTAEMAPRKARLFL